MVKTTPGLETNRKGGLIVEEGKGQTSRRRVYAGGDAVTGAATVILAMGAGRTAAASIQEYLTTGVWELREQPEEEAIA